MSLLPQRTPADLHPGGAIRTLALFFFYYGIHSLMFGGYPPAANGYPPTAIGYPPTAIGYPPTTIGYPPTAIGYTPTAIGYPPTAIGYPPTAIGYPPTTIGYPPTAIGYPPTAIGYTPTAIGYPPAAIVGRIGHSEFFFSFHYGTPCLHPLPRCFADSIFHKAFPAVFSPGTIRMLQNPDLTFNQVARIKRRDRALQLLIIGLALTALGWGFVAALSGLWMAMQGAISGGGLGQQQTQ